MVLCGRVTLYVMPLHTCPTCGAISDQRYCERHRNQGRDLAKHQRFARAVLKRDGHRCTKCGSTDNLRAAHIIPFAAMLNPERDGYDPANGRTLCERCDLEADPNAAPTRGKRPPTKRQRNPRRPIPRLV